MRLLTAKVILTQLFGAEHETLEKSPARRGMSVFNKFGPDFFN